LTPPSPPWISPRPTASIRICIAGRARGGPLGRALGPRGRRNLRGL
jgi:hypothetical protein